MGKAKRFNPYDETVKASRERAKAFGEGRQKLAGITSPFRSSPLEPPITTKLRGTGTGDGKFLTVSLAGDQTANIAVNNHIEFDTKDEDGGIVLQTGAGQADGIFELLGGRKYYLQASLRPEFSGTTGQLEVAWFDQTNSAQIGSRAKYEAMDHSGNDANQPTAAALFTPTTNVLVKLEILSVTALDALANEYCLANLFEIALGGVVLGGGGGGGSGVTFPITPSINDHGNVGTVTEDINIGASTGHVHKLTLTGNPTLTFSNPPSSGVQMEFEIEFVQDATGGRTITHPASVAETVTISTTASATTIITYRTNDNGTTYHAIPALRGSISLGATAFATKELDNLGTTSINSDLIPSSSATKDIGSKSPELYFSDIFIGTINLGDATDDVTITGVPSGFAFNADADHNYVFQLNSVTKATLSTSSLLMGASVDIDLNGTNKLIIDADGDTDITDGGQDDDIDFNTGGAGRMTVNNSALTMFVDIRMGGNDLQLDSDLDTSINSTNDDTMQFFVGATHTLTLQPNKLIFADTGHLHDFTSTTTSLTLDMGAATDSFLLRFGGDTDLQYTFTDNHVITISDLLAWTFESTYKPGTPADGNVFAVYQYNFKNDNGDIEPWGEFKFTAVDVSNNSENTKLEISLIDGGALESALELDNSINRVRFASNFSLDMQNNDIDNADEVNMVEGIFTEAAAPGTPNTGTVVLYAKTDSKLYYKNDAGTEFEIAVV